ncbi:3-hydroxyacyl-CoA dehydrogenase/enoyl-CoA hydratase family protein [Elstera cyanobacteriorum]|uniref:3-hydroxyacyl-CoA dehydrogenase/enoyl-CoA hydratase family protein n=1 Tax=Elstera cyanobacteriorum TaxID=2022747 RepID=UPI0023540906|nr:3-hydroxyacyl-CoA dehydrogenase/enoyl-CoA hydratase family protein [Elstera cyanobacteriorum]MCK6441752.1 3-hydroxyacyl-CoA dehydrogenase NAD-binding domain-containing protein [Elstera cyanobacteriorum]
MSVQKACVIGAGVMGAGIAAHIANAGIPVLLLDIAAKEGDRTAITKGAIDKLLKTDPAPLMHKDAAKLITPGNLEDDLAKVADCDWIVEAIVENLEIKRGLYEKLEALKKPEAVVSSNTSTIPLKYLVEGRSDAFRKTFMITHFFNPPRYMRLLELVGGPETDKAALARIEDFCDRALGKGVVPCKDTPGFIANRIGTYWIQVAVNEAIALGLSVEEADAIGGRPMGIPKTGVFGLIDLVGLDLMPLIAKSMKSVLPPTDDFIRTNIQHPLLDKMIADGYTGRKGKGGFYRLNAVGKKKVKEAIDLKTGEYRAAQKPKPEALDRAGRSLKALVTDASPHGEFAKRVLVQTLGYTASLVPEIADSVVAVDEAMRLGYNWSFGPFELIDQVGVDWLAAEIAASGKPVPALLETAKGKSFYRQDGGKLEFLGTDGAYHPVVRRPGVLLLADVKRGAEPVLKNASASVWDIGDGVLCFEFTSKMNSLDSEIMALLAKTVQTIPAKGYKGLVVYNEGTNFSVGANLGLALFAANIALWPAIEEIVEGGQKTYKALKYAPFPVVGAPSGMALGGGCEILLHCDAVQAHAETYMGLVEVGVGIIPGWGGCKEMLQRWLGLKRRPGGPMPAIAKVFETISTAQVSKSAALAKELLYLRAEDGITMNRDRLLADAKAKVLALAEGYQPPAEFEFRLPGPTAKLALDMAVDGAAGAGKATPHDITVSKTLAEVLTGGPNGDVTVVLKEDDILALERSNFMRLAKNPKSLARMEHMLETGKPLRN